MQVWLYIVVVLIMKQCAIYINVKRFKDPCLLFSDKPNEKVCCRCGTRFFLSPNMTRKPDGACVYHWGRSFKRRGEG